MSNRLGGKQGTSYLGTNADQPGNWVFAARDPNQYDTANVSIGDWWLNQNTDNVWVLVSLQGDATSKGPLATWKPFGSGSGITSLTGNSGGTVFGDGSQNITVVGDGTSIDIVGNPGAHTLTVSAMGTVPQEFTTDDTNHAVPSAGNLNVAGGTGIVTSCVNGSDTITISANGTTATSFVSDSGTATPSVNVIEIIGNTAAGHTGIATVGSTNVIKVGTDGTLAARYNADGATHAIPSAGILTVTGAGGITASGSGSTLTITGGGAISETFHTDSGDAVPAANALTIAGTNGISTSGAGSTVTITTPAIASFTPSLTFGGAATGMTYASRVGYYKHAGDILNFNIFIALTAKGSSSGQAVITGLPVVTPASTFAAVSLRYINVSYAGNTFLEGYFDGTTLQLEELAASGLRTKLDNTNFANNSGVMVSGSILLS